MAEALAQAGADIVGVSATLEAEGSELEKRVRGAGRAFTGLAADFAQPEAVRGLIDAIVALDCEVDILVNNAGTIARAPAVDHSDADWDRVVQVDLTSQFVLSRELGRGMLARGSGKVIFTASMLSFQGGINVPGYAAAKSGVVGLDQGAVQRMGVTTASTSTRSRPGYIATDNTQALYDDPDRHSSILERIPAGRWGTPADLAGATVFLASAASDYVNGIVLPVDGGWLGR